MKDLPRDKDRTEIKEGGQLNVCARQCGECLFGPKPHIPWEPFGREKVEKILAMESHFVCHEFKNAMCRGFFNKHQKDLWYTRLAICWDKINWVKREDK